MRCKRWRPFPCVFGIKAVCLGGLGLWTQSLSCFLFLESTPCVTWGPWGCGSSSSTESVSFIWSIGNIVCCLFIYYLFIHLFIVVYSDSLWPHGLWPTSLLYPWNFSGKNTGMGSHFLFQGIFPTQGLTLCPLLWQTDSLPLSYLRSP